jgi:hypothetical protein
LKKTLVRSIIEVISKLYFILLNKCLENYYTKNVSQFKYIYVKSYLTEIFERNYEEVIVAYLMKLGNIQLMESIWLLLHGLKEKQREC